MDEDPFFRTLTATEMSYWEIYAQRWPGAACQLNQDPQSGHGMHTSDLWLHALIHNMGLIACDSIPRAERQDSELEMPNLAVRRWMTPTEALATQGFPVHPHFPPRVPSALSRPGELLCSFNFPQPRKLRATCGQAGNSMNVTCAGVLDLHYLCCLKLVPISPLFHTIALANMRKRCVEDVEEPSSIDGTSKASTTRAKLLIAR